MGMQDRDYYKEWWRNRTGYKERASFRKPESDPNDAKYDPKQFRSTKKPVEEPSPKQARPRGKPPVDVAGPPDMPGASWHWALQVLVWSLVMAGLFFVFKGVEKHRLLKRVVDAQHEQIQSQAKRIKELENTLNRQKSKVDFFK